MSSMTALVGRRALADYARRPLNLVLLAAVPVVLVFVWGAALADFSKLFGGAGDRTQIEAATAGWAAAALAGLAGFFQVTGSRSSDRRLAVAGGRHGPVVAGRVGASFCLAMVAAVGGLAALALRVGINDPVRAIAATVVVAIIYLSLGVLIGTVVKAEMNGALLVTLAWVFDVFLGPTMVSASPAMTRLFPLHYPTLVLTGLPSGHAGPLGDVGWSILWAIGLSTVAVVRLAVTTRPAPAPAPTAMRTGTAILPALAPTGAPRQTLETRPSLSPPAPARPVAISRAALTAGDTTSLARVGAVLRAGMREYRRNRVLWALLVVVPAVFIGMAIMVTIDEPGPIALVEDARHFTALLSQRRMHAATMVPITAAFLAGLTGLFVVTGSAGGDRRLVLAGLRPREVFAGRLGVIGAATVLTTVVAIAVSAAWYPPGQWVVFAAANLLIALTYATIGVLVGPLTGRLGGIYLILLLAFIDVGLGQSPMLGGPPAWGAFLPARGASRAMVDGAFTAHFDEFNYLLLGLAWLAAFTAASAAVFRRSTARAGLANGRSTQ